MKKLLVVMLLLVSAAEVEAPMIARRSLTGWERSVVMDGPAIATRWQKAIEHALSRERDVPRDLIVGIMLTESMGHPRAQNSSGAVGLLGVKPVVCKELRMRSCNLLNPHENLSAGVRYLNLLQRRYGFTGEKLILAYGVGPERARGIIGADKRRAVTHAYVRKVLYARGVSKRTSAT